MMYGKQTHKHTPTPTHKHHYTHVLYSTYMHTDRFSKDTCIPSPQSLQRRRSRLCSHIALRGAYTVCNVLQCVAVCCSVLQWHTCPFARTPCCAEPAQCVVCCGVLQCVAVCCSVLQCVAVTHMSACPHAVLRRACTVCNVLRCVAVCCSVLQCVAAPYVHVLACRIARGLRSV